MPSTPPKMYIMYIIKVNATNNKTIVPHLCIVYIVTFKMCALQSISTKKLAPINFQGLRLLPYVALD